MSTIESLVVAQTPDLSNPGVSSMTRDELEAELERLRRREALLVATEEIAHIGHYEWNYEHDRLETCSEEYARIFNMTLEQVMLSQSTWERTLQQIHPDDREYYKAAREQLRSTKALDFKYRIRLADGSIRHLREIGIVIVDKDGAERGSFGIVQDISAQVNYERELEYRDDLARHAESITDIGHFIFDEDSERYQHVSDGLARIYGTTPEEYVNRIQSFADDLSVVFEEDRQRVAEEYRYYRETGQDCALEYRIRRKDGAIRWVRELGRAKKSQSGRVTQTLGVVQDITERVKHEQELLFKDALANQAEAITDIGHYIYDEINQEYLFVSPGLVRIHGRDRQELLDLVGYERDLELIHAEDREQVQQAYDEFLAGGEEWRVDYRLVRADGTIRWVREMGKAYLIGHGMPEQTIGVLQDITAQKDAEQEIIKAKKNLEQQVVLRTRELANTVKQLQDEVQEREKIAAELDFLANHDALTGLPSLRLCKDRLEHSLAEARRNRQMSAVMFLDLDGFKEVNDTHGHELGDFVLKVTADRIKNEIRETDTVARIGGDEFIIILSSLPQIGIAERIAKSIIEQVSRKIYIEDTEVAVSVSIGISLYPEQGTTPEVLIREADRAMYRVKHKRKNGFGFAQTAAD